MDARPIRARDDGHRRRPFVKDGDVLFAGTGVAMLAATVAKRIHAPHAVIFFETGGIDPPWRSCPWPWPTRG